MTVPTPEQSRQVLDRLGRLSAQRAAHRTLTETEAVEIEENSQSCDWCGGYHARACPRVRRIEWSVVGGQLSITSVEFWQATDIDWTGVIFTDDGDSDPALVLTPDVEADLDLVLSWFDNAKTLVASKTNPGGPDLLQRVRRLRLALEEARTYGVPSEDAAPA